VQSLQTLKEKLANRLDINKKESSVNIDNIKSLSETMSVEKIAAIKAKRLANKRVIIKRNENDEGNDLRGMIEYDFDSTNNILSRETVTHEDDDSSTIHRTRSGSREPIIIIPSMPNSLITTMYTRSCRT
jgi:Paf1 complex subunit CDC73 N-terminal